MNDLTKLANTLNAGRVRRWHTKPTLSQNVAEHSFGAAVIAIYLLLENDNPADFNLGVIIGALLHDAPELFTGDIPAPVRDKLESLSAFAEIEEQARNKVFTMHALSQTQANIIFYADKLEAALFAIKHDALDIAEFNFDAIKQRMATDTFTPPDIKERVQKFYAVPFEAERLRK
jgi:5'-deoxynucleotidase YfbR-like HD superfamily hydrolase